MVTEHTHRGGCPPRGDRLRRPLAALSRLTRLGDIPVVVMLAWAGWLAVPWSFNGLAQARAAAAAAAADAEPPALQAGSTHQPPAFPAALLGGPSGHTPLGQPDGPPSAGTDGSSPGAVEARWADAEAGPHASSPWCIPAARAAHPTTVRPSRECPPQAVPPTTTPADETTEPAHWTPRSASQADVVALERARIAGEVHDAAGHGLAAIAMQAGIALVTLDDDPEQARASLRAIRETSTTALAQLRAALDGIDPPGGDLPGLIEGVRAAGLPVDVEPADLVVPSHLQGAVYRVVRESLTNVLRHAGPTRALVRTGGERDTFVLEVADRGVGWTGADEGRGLAGMRARVTEAGGHFAAGPREGGGFQVVATFPQVAT
ncbi:histidine kinase [Nonomuraea sp. NPDC046802]|uniref:sensor histidine kinase n=1 Tax=Nonomuraea sp. NPDC046802 TaxID=3154919 RepID=UPI0033FE75E0